MALSTAGKPSTVFILNPLVMDNGYYRTKISFPFPVRVVGNAPSVVLGDWVSFGNLMHSGSEWNPRKLPGLESTEVHIVNRGVRTGIREAVQARMKVDTLGLFEGLLWGDTSMLSRLRLEQFRGTGLIHLLAVSGMNIGGVMLLSSLLVGGLARIPGVLRAVSSQRLFLASYVMIGVAYLLLAGFPAGLTRAYMMGGMALLGFMSASESRAMQALFVAFFVIVLWSPSVVSEVSFQLSFLSTCAVIVSAGLLRAIQRRVRGVPNCGAFRYLLALSFTSLFVTLTLAP
jgi:competence protein ComEC